MVHIAWDTERPFKAVERHMAAVFEIFYAAQAGVQHAGASCSMPQPVLLPTVPHA